MAEVVLDRLQSLRAAADLPPLEEVPKLSTLAHVDAADWALSMALHTSFPQQVPAPGQEPAFVETDATRDAKKCFPGLIPFSIKLPVQELAQIELEALMDGRYEQIGVGVEQMDTEPAAIVLLARPKLSPGPA